MSAKKLGSTWTNPITHARPVLLVVLPAKTLSLATPASMTITSEADLIYAGTHVCPELTLILWVNFADPVLLDVLLVPAQQLVLLAFKITTSDLMKLYAQILVLRAPTLTANSARSVLPVAQPAPISTPAPPASITSTSD